MTRSKLLIAVLALAATACSRGDARSISTDVADAEARTAYQASSTGFSTPIEPQVQARSIAQTPFTNSHVPAPREAAGQTLTDTSRDRQIRTHRSNSVAPIAAHQTLIKPRKSIEVARAQSEFERLNSGTPRAYDIPVDKPTIYSPFPRRKPTGRSPVTVTQRLAAPKLAGEATSIPAPHYSVATTGGQSVPPTIEYHIPHLPQKEPLWCWAAAAQQAIGWVNNGRAPTQCAIVGLAHGISPKECCADPKGVCARTGEIPAIAALVRRFGGQAAEAATVPRDPKEIYRILQGGGTLLIRLRPAPHDAAVGIRHMIVVRGIEWLRLPNGRLNATLHYNDPLGSGQRSVDFDEIVGFFEQALIIHRSS